MLPSRKPQPGWMADMNHKGSPVNREARSEVLEGDVMPKGLSWMESGKVSAEN